MAYLLIVDDDEDFATAEATILKSKGYEVEIELDIERARKSIQTRKPDLLILDVMFPESNMAGIEFAREIRHSDEPIKSLPILLLTAVNQKFPLGFDSDDIDENWLPVTDFLEKPVDFDVMSDKVDEILSKIE